MDFTDTAILILAIFCAVALTPAIAVAAGLIFSLAVEAGRGITNPVVRVLGSKKWRRYEHREITGQ